MRLLLLALSLIRILRFTLYKSTLCAWKASLEFAFRHILLELAFALARCRVSSGTAIVHRSRHTRKHSHKACGYFRFRVFGAVCFFGFPLFCRRDLLNSRCDPSPSVWPFLLQVDNWAKFQALK